MTPYRNLYRLLFLLLLTVWSQCHPSNLNCGTAGSATSAGGHGTIGSTSDTTLTVSETSGGSAISRSEYIPGETLYVDMSTSQEYLIEMTNNGATFNSGGFPSCSYRKNNGNKLTFQTFVCILNTASSQDEFFLFCLSPSKVAAQSRCLEPDPVL